MQGLLAPQPFSRRRSRSTQLRFGWISRQYSSKLDSSLGAATCAKIGGVMDPVTLTIAIRGLGLLFLVLGGVYALRRGFHIIQTGRGDRSRATFKFLGLSSTASGVGAVIMMTAVGWAYLGVRMAPNLAMDKSGMTKVYAFATANGQVTVPELAVATHRMGEATRTANAFDAGELRNMFSRAVSASHGDATLQGAPAMIDASAASVAKNRAGQYELSAPLRSSGNIAVKEAQITFAAENRGGATVFVPQAATIPGAGS